MSCPPGLEFPDPICQHCAGYCSTTEVVSTLHVGGWELWCYCEACDIETNHPPVEAPP
jgi:hypothetical protein